MRARLPAYGRGLQRAADPLKEWLAVQRADAPDNSREKDLVEGAPQGRGTSETPGDATDGAGLWRVIVEQVERDERAAAGGAGASTARQA